MKRDTKLNDVSGNAGKVSKEKKAKRKKNKKKRKNRAQGEHENEKFKNFIYLKTVMKIEMM